MKSMSKSKFDILWRVESHISLISIHLNPKRIILINLSGKGAWYKKDI